MMITAGGKKRRLRSELPQFKAQHVAIKFQRAFEVGHFQMHMADADPRINGRGCRIVFHGDKMDENGCERKKSGRCSHPA